MICLRDIIKGVIYICLVCCMDMSRSIRNLKGKKGIFVIL